MSEHGKNDYIREYGWNWFNYHAGQRTSMFNYSLAAASLLAAGFGAAIDHHPRVASVIAFVGALVTWSFFLVDGRNDRLVRRGERVLKALEQIDFPNVTSAPASAAQHPMPGGILIANEEGVRAPAENGFWRLYLGGAHRIHLRLIEAIFCFAFLVGAALVTCKPDAFQSKEPPIAESVRILSEQVMRLNASLQAVTDRLANIRTMETTGSSQQSPAASPAAAPGKLNERH